MKIIDIREEFDFKFDKDPWQEFDGYFIETDTDTIKLGIRNSRSCCEIWGYFMSEDTFDKFIGSEILNIKISDEQLNTSEWDINNMYEGGCTFVNFETDKGLLQFVAYNEHNGYYGHEFVVISKYFNYEECL